MFVGKRHNPLQASGRVCRVGERLHNIGMVMRTKIKEIIATGGKFGMRGEFLFPGRGVFLFGCWFVHLEFFSSRLLYKYLDEYLGSGVISKGRLGVESFGFWVIIIKTTPFFPYFLIFRIARRHLESSRGTVVPHMLVVCMYSTTLTGRTSELYNQYQVQVSTS